VNRAAILASALALTLLACNGSIRFDEQTADAGDSNVGGDGTGTSCPNGSCGWVNDDCDGSVCRQACPAATTCVGTCGSACAAECESTSHCTLTTGRSASVVCDAHATCTFVLGDRASGACAAGSSCNVRCVEYCNLDCDTGATCELQCASGTSKIVSGLAACP
jgi:hypothetical protein